MNLVMFDIDGTLTATTDIDEQCFVRAVEDVLGIDDIDTNLANYTHVTDESIAAEIIHRHTGREATDSELEGIRTYFVGLIARHTEDQPELFRPIAGAREMLGVLSEKTGCGVSLATGGWRGSAILKLRFAGLDVGTTPMATSDDARSREAIMQLSEARAQKIYGVSGFESVVYVGDGIWDVRSTHALGYRFIGVAAGERATQLSSEGAAHIVADFAEENGFLGILETLLEA